MENRDFEKDWQQSACMLDGLGPNEMQLRYMLRHWMYQYTQLEAQLAQAKADNAGLVEVLRWIKNNSDTGFLYMGQMCGKGTGEAIQKRCNEALSSPHPGADLLRELADLKSELEEGDYWKQHVEKFIENGGCPWCFGGDEEGHKADCDIGRMEVELEQVRQYIRCIHHKECTPEFYDADCCGCYALIQAKEALADVNT